MTLVQYLNIRLKRYLQILRAVRQHMEAEEIDLWISLLWKWVRLNWAMSVSLIVPLKVRNEARLGQVATMAKRLSLEHMTLQYKFPKYRYDKMDWLREQGADR